MTMRVPARGLNVVHQRPLARKGGVTMAGSRQVRTILRDGVAVHGGTVVVRGMAAENAELEPVHAVVASKKVGGAVLRNRAKRRIREALRAAGAPQGLDLVVVARGGALTVPMAALESELGTLLERLRTRLVQVPAPDAPQS